MGTPLVSLEALGKKVSTALAAYSTERARALQTARRKLLARAVQRPLQRSVHLRYGLALAATVVVVVGLALFWTRPPRPLAFTADGRAGSVQTWVAAPRERAVPVRFSDGTQLRVEPSSRVRVVAVDPHGASIALENGAMHADVVHDSDSAWQVIAGPLTVRVTGTRFDLRWSALTEEFSISVTEGSVAVMGSVVGAERPVRAGETLRVLVGERRLELTKGPAGPEPRQISAAQAAQPSPEPAPRATARNAAPETAGEPAPASAAAERGADWRELAQSGSLRKAFAAAEASGFARACEAATAAELLQLGDAARLSGRPDRANQALLSLRTRYPGDPRRAAAAFMLGKVAFDHTHAYAQAAEWFKTSIREQPSGSLTREASGRLVEALQKSGDAAGARRAAEDYLARHPRGPHADLARSLVR